MLGGPSFIYNLIVLSAPSGQEGMFANSTTDVYRGKYWSRTNLIEINSFVPKPLG